MVFKCIFKRLYIISVTIRQVHDVTAWGKPQEESPGCNRTGLHLTDGWSNPRESATEKIPPAWPVRVKRRGKSPPGKRAIFSAW